MYPLSLQELFLKHKGIGWDQIFNGCFAVSWASKVTIDSKGTVNGTIFYSQVIQAIWHTILLHGPIHGIKTLM